MAEDTKIILDTRFYGFGAILQGAKDYLDNFYLILDGDPKDKAIVFLKAKNDEEIKNLQYEFTNYVLGLMQNAVF